MTVRRVALVGSFVLAAAAVAWVLFIGLPRWYVPKPPAPAAVPTPLASEPERRISVRLFYVADDGTRLTSAEHEVPYAENLVDQAREILIAQIAAPPTPFVSAIPAGTALRALFVIKGEAFVDLSREVSTAHPGGSLDELLTIYTIVHALTLNVPAITSVQLLVEGKEVDTLAGHVDLRRPFSTRLPLTIEN